METLFWSHCSHHTGEEQHQWRHLGWHINHFLILTSFFSSTWGQNSKLLLYFLYQPPLNTHIFPPSRTFDWDIGRYHYNCKRSTSYLTSLESGVREFQILCNVQEIKNAPTSRQILIKNLFSLPTSESYHHSVSFDLFGSECSIIYGGSYTSPTQYIAVLPSSTLFS